MVNDPIGDMIIQIKNAGMSRKRVIEIPCSNLKEQVAGILVREKYLESVKRVGVAPREKLSITLKFISGDPLITGVKRISKPGLRWYVKKSAIPTVAGGSGIVVISTPKGVMTGKDAEKNGFGGEVICEIW